MADSVCIWDVYQAHVFRLIHYEVVGPLRSRAYWESLSHWEAS